jgi:DNA-binding transcriptional regulator YdaS (Cro superfamily)
MNLKDYFKDKPRGAKIEMAKRLGITKTWMALIINERQVPSASLAVLIHEITGGEVSKESLRPDLFGGAR